MNVPKCILKYIISIFSSDTSSESVNRTYKLHLTMEMWYLHVPAKVRHLIIDD